MVMPLFFDSSPGLAMANRDWWSGKCYILALLLLMAVPLLWPHFPPLNDVPAHMGRYRVQAGTAGAPTLADIFSIHWIPVGNLGVDILVYILQPLLGVELATKIVVTLIPVITAAGMLFIAAEAHGELPPTAAFALPLAYGYPFQFGFVNYTLAVGLALLAFGFVLRLNKRNAGVAKPAFMLAAGIVIYFAHIMGWIIFGLFCSAESLARRTAASTGLLQILKGVIADCAVLAAPLVFILIWRGGDNGGMTSAPFDLHEKWGWIQSALRDRWVGWDGDSALLLVGLFILCCLRGFQLDRRLGAALLLLAVFFLAIPRAFFGLIYADMRLAPLLIALGLLALRPRQRFSRTTMHVIAAAAMLFCVARVAATTVSFALYAKQQEHVLQALTKLPRGSRVVALVNLPCNRGWSPPRIAVASMAIVRNDAFVNDQFDMPGAQLLKVGPSIPAKFAYGDSEWVKLPSCNRADPLLADQIASIPRDRFDHLWLLGVPMVERPHLPWLRILWENDESALYAISSVQ
jgi:hypothetical protein